MSSSSNSPCAACKLLRRKCTQGCVFAPYFPPDNPGKFSSVHRVFGASNVSKLLSELPHAQREDAVNSLAYEAEARLRDPVYGCVSYISMLQLRIKQVRDEIANARKELAGYIGPAALAQFGPFIAAPPPQQHHQQYGPTGMGLAVPVGGPGPQQQQGGGHGHHPHPHQQQQMMMMVQQQLHQQRNHLERNLAAAVEVAREQQHLMMRQASVYAGAPGASGSGGGGGATVAVVPPDAVPLPYEGGGGGGGFFFQQQQQQQQQAGPSHAQAAMALTYQMEQSPPLSSSGRSHPEVSVSQQQNTDGSDEGSIGGGAAAACPRPDLT